VNLIDLCVPISFPSTGKETEGGDLDFFLAPPSQSSPVKGEEARSGPQLMTDNCEPPTVCHSISAIALAMAPWKLRSDGQGLLGAAQDLLRGQVIDDVALEDLFKQVGMIDVGVKMDLDINVLVFLFDAEFGFLAFDQTLGQGAAGDDLIVVAPFEDMRAGEPFEPGFFLAQWSQA